MQRPSARRERALKLPQNPKLGKRIDFVVVFNIYEIAWRLLSLSKSQSILKV